MKHPTRTASHEAHNRNPRTSSGTALFMVILVTAIVVAACTQSSLRGVFVERRNETQQNIQRQLDAAIKSTDRSVAARQMKVIVLPVNSNSNERIEIIRNGNSVTARWMTGDIERESLTHLEP